MIFNATCRIIEPVQQDSQDDYLQRDHNETTHAEQRCSLRQTTRSSEATVLGALSLNSYSCRLQTALPVAADWRLKIRKDGEDWRDYTVRRVGDLGFYKLLSVERV